MNDKALMVVFVLILGSVLTTALVGVDQYTKDRIEANRQLKIRTRVLEALDILYTKDRVEEKFSESVKIEEIEEKRFYTSQDGNIAFEFAGSGLWGAISGVLALSPDLETIKGLTIIRQNETPGLGGRIAEEDFLNRFSGKKISPKLVITRPDKASAENEVDGITGATLTCKAFEKIVNEQVEKYVSLYRKGNQ